MDQSILSELNGMKDAFLKISTEICRVGSFLEKAIEKTAVNANRPNLQQTTPPFYPQLPMNNSFYMIQNGQLVPCVFPFQSPTLPGYFPTNQAQAAPTTQVQPQLAFQASQTIPQPAKTVEQNNASAASTSSSLASQAVMENGNLQSSQSTLEENNAGVNSNSSNNLQSQNLQSTNDNPVVENGIHSSCSREVNRIVQSTAEENLPASTSTLQLVNQNGLNNVSSSSQNVPKIKEEHKEELNNVNVSALSTSGSSQSVRLIKEEHKEDLKIVKNNTPVASTSNSSAQTVEQNNVTANTSSSSASQGIIENGNHDFSTHELESSTRPTSDARETGVSSAVGENTSINSPQPQVDANDDDDFCEIIFEGPLVQSTRPQVRPVVPKSPKNDIPFRTISRRCHIRGCASDSQDMFTGTQLKQHIAEAHDGKGIICIALPGCFETFKTQAELENHLKTVHKNVNRFSCASCNTSFPDHAKHLIHLYGYHIRGEYRCTVCNHKGEYLYLLHEHNKSTHKNNRSQPPSNSISESVKRRRNI